MKPLAIWLAVVVVVFGGYALITSSTRGTTQVFVFVDSSNPMSAVARKVPRELDRIDDKDHAVFALAEGHRNQSELLHTFQSKLVLGTFQPFAPCSFADIDTFPEAAEADQKILITTPGSTSSPDCDTATLVGWDIIELSP